MPTFASRDKPFLQGVVYQAIIRTTTKSGVKSQNNILMRNEIEQKTLTLHL
jgi:hypothetical protein